MFDIIRQIINHVWENQYTGDQTVIYQICGVLICTIVVWILGELNSLLQFFRRK